MLRANGMVCAWSIGFVRVIGGVGRALPVLAGAACLATLAGSAVADVKAVEPRLMVMSTDGAMRCDTGNIYYNVRTLKAGEMIRVDGEGGGWLRVEYPSGTKAYVRADEASFDSATKAVTLTKATKLMAANEAGARPWWPLMPTDVSAGTKFAAAEAVRGADGAVDGYLIAAPSGAHGFIRAEQARVATPAEITKASGAPATPVASAPEPVVAKPEVKVVTKPAEPKPVTQPGLDAATNALVAASTSAATTPKPVETKPVAGTTPPLTPVAVSPPTILKTEPPAAAPTKPAETPVAAASDDAKIIEIKAGSSSAVAPVEPTPLAKPRAAIDSNGKPELTKRIDDIKVLRDMFERALQPGTDEAEVSTVISEFNRTIDSLPTGGDEGKIRKGLQQRISALKMRQEIIETKRKLADTSQIDEQMRQIKLAIEQVQKQAIYATVGRMLPSTVYDGKRGMPLMYRVESADFSSTRTIGYVIPAEGMDLLPYLGKIVGIVGETRMDPALALNIIAPTRIDEMRVTGGKLEVIQGTFDGLAPQPAPETPAATPPAPAPAKPAAPAAARPETAPKSQPIATPGTDDGDMNK